MDAVRRRTALSIFQLLAAGSLFALNASLSKVVLTAGIEPARLTALRCTGAAVGMGLILALTNPGRLKVKVRDLPALAVLGLTGAALIQWLYFVAIDRLPVGIALLLEFTGPVLVALYSRVVLGHTIRRQVWLALGLALAGLAMVAQVWQNVGLDPVGVAAGLGAATCLATFYLLGKQTVEHRDPMGLTFWMFAFAAGFWAVAQPWWSFDASVLAEQASLLGALDTVHIPLWLGLAGIVGLGTLAPYALHINAMRHLSPITTGVIGMLEPVLAAAVAWIWLDQVLNGIQVAGGLLVLAGVGFAQAQNVLSAPPVVTDG